MRIITYREALSEALVQLMESDERVCVLGVDANDSGGIFKTTIEAHEKFGDKRVSGSPLSESAQTGIGIGMAIAGYRPILIDARVDFSLLRMNQLINHGAYWPYMHGDRVKVSLVLRAVIGRGRGQAAQHAQSLQALFAHIPNIKVVMPATPRDAKGLLIGSVYDGGIVVFLDHRWLLLSDIKGEVFEKYYSMPLYGSNIMRIGNDITIVAVSYMTHEAMKAASILADEYKISAEVIDLRIVKPLDYLILYNSIAKTGRLLVADTAWKSFGISAEIIASVSENCFYCFKCAPSRVASPDLPCGAGASYEREYYPDVWDIVSRAEAMVKGEVSKITKERMKEESQKVLDEGPF